MDGFTDQVGEGDQGRVAVDTAPVIYARLARTPLRFDGKTLPWSISCGLPPAPTDTVETAKARADQAYEAKRVAGAVGG